jgi:hypothetical protein
VGGRTMNHDEESSGDDSWLTRIPQELVDKFISGMISELYTSLIYDPVLREKRFPRRLAYVIEELLCDAAIHAYNSAHGDAPIRRTAATDADVLIVFSELCRHMHETQERSVQTFAIRNIIKGSDSTS